jgi:threonine dehydratase
MSVEAADIAAVRPAVRGIARQTPVLSSRTFSERSGGDVMLKAENLQRTGSFKVRGAAAKLAALGDACARGVVCASAGNHGQGVAGADAARRGACEV